MFVQIPSQVRKWLKLYLHWHHLRRALAFIMWSDVSICNTRYPNGFSCKKLGRWRCHELENWAPTKSSPFQQFSVLAIFLLPVLKNSHWWIHPAIYWTQFLARIFHGWPPQGSDGVLLAQRILIYIDTLHPTKRCQRKGGGGIKCWEKQWEIVEIVQFYLQLF